jgi:hypothetical protein
MLTIAMPAAGKAAEEISVEVEAGKYPDVAAVMAAFQQKIAGAMMPGGGR